MSIDRRLSDLESLAVDLTPAPSKYDYSRLSVDELRELRDLRAKLDETSAPGMDTEQPMSTDELRFRDLLNRCVVNPRTP